MKKTINIFRSVAIILIILNSIWTLGGGRIFEHAMIRPFVELCGEVGVTALFVAFGYEVFVRFKAVEGNAEDTISTEGKGIGFIRHSWNYIRFIAPEYYVFFLATLIISGSGYFKASNLGNILAHVFCLQGYFPEYAEAINPTLWIIGLFVWFIVIARPIYKLMRMKRIGNAVPFIFIGISVITKFLLIKHLGFVGNPWVNENILTTIEAFVIGMYIAQAEEDKESEEQTNNRTCIVLVIMGALLLYFACIRIGGVATTTGANVYGYIFHTFISLLIALMIYFANLIKLPKREEEGTIGKCFRWLERNVYAIIICHWIVIRFLLTHFEFLQRLFQNGFVRFGGLTVIAVVSGWVLRLVGDVIRKLLKKG